LNKLRQSQRKNGSFYFDTTSHSESPKPKGLRRQEWRETGKGTTANAKLPHFKLGGGSEQGRNGRRSHGKKREDAIPK